MQQPDPEPQQQPAGPSNHTNEDFIVFSANEMPNTPSLNPNNCIPVGFTVTPLHPTFLSTPQQASAGEGPVPLLRKDPLKCAKCTAYITRFSQLHASTGTWNCVFCAFKNRSPGLEMESSPELSAKMVDYADPTKQPLNRNTASTTTVPTHIFIIDKSLNHTHTADLKRVLQQAVSCLVPTDRVALITFSNTVTALRFSQLHAATSDVPDQNADFAAKTSPVSTQELEAMVGLTVCENDVFAGYCRLVKEDLESVAQNVDSYCGEMSQHKDKLIHAISTLNGVRGRDDMRSRRRRALGVALELATTLIKGSLEGRRGVKNAQHGGTKIFVFTGGACNYGPGAAPQPEELLDDLDEGTGDSTNATNSGSNPRDAFYNEISESLAKLRGSVYVFGVGYADLWLAHTLQPCVMRTGGRTILHNDLTAVRSVVHDLMFCMRGKSSSSSGGGVVGAEKIVVVCSEGVSVDRIVGPGLALVDSLEGLTPAERERELAARQRVNITTCSLTGCVSGDVSFSFFLTGGDIPQDQVYAQVCVWFTSPSGDFVERVFTKELRTTGNAVNFLSSVDTTAAATLAAKLLVLHARKQSRGTLALSANQPSSTHSSFGFSGTSADTLNQLNSRVTQVASAFGQFFPNFEGSDVNIIPPELSDFVYRLFLLRTGPLLGPILQHADNIECLRCLFLQSTPVACARMILPDVVMAGETGSQELVMCETLALQSDYVLFVDQQTDIFIWSGRNTSTPDFEKIRAQWAGHAVRVAAQRFPTPVIKSFKEGSSMSRWLVCRMIPSHKDRPNLQEHFFPQITRLGEDKRGELCRKLPFTDEPTLHQWLASLNVVIGTYSSVDNTEL